MEGGPIPAINPGLVPTIPAGRLFTRLTTDETLLIRWLTATDPVFSEVMNRPIADSALRTLIIAKAVDQLSSNLGHQALYPFLIQPRVGSGTDQAAIPTDWIWDISIAAPVKWKQLRLARIRRLSGENGTTTGYTGILRLSFAAGIQGSSQETIILTCDYTIDSALTYQMQTLRPPTSSEDIGAINADESQTVAGYIIFKTMDTTQIAVTQFLDLVAPPIPPTISGTGGFYDSPAVYDIADSSAGGTTSSDDFSFVAVAHGTGMLTDSAWCPLPALNADIQTWLDSFNYPFDSTADRTSDIGIQIPRALFREFDLVAPAGDEPPGASSGLYFPVWMSRIELINSNTIRIFFSTHNVTEAETGGTPSLVAIEFASLDLVRSMIPGEVVQITPLNNLHLKGGANADQWHQGFGRGHVVLSNIWSDASIIGDFYGSFSAILTTPQDTVFPQSSGRLSSYGLSRVPKYAPTIGQARALLGSTSRLSQPIDPGAGNRYVCEQDVGLGNQIDLEAVPGIVPHAAIERYGYTGCNLQRTFILKITASELGTDPNFYQNVILPRMRVLLGRDPIFGDTYFTGVSWFRFNGDSWQST